MSEIRLRADASQAIGEFKSLNSTVVDTGDTLGALSKNLSDPKEIDALLNKIKELNKAAAEKERQMPGFYGFGQLSDGTGNKGMEMYSGGAGTAQEIARLKMTIENLNRNIEKTNDEISKANENGDAKTTFNWIASLNQMEEAKHRAQNELKRLEASETDKEIEALVKDRKAQMYSQAWNYAIQGANIYNGYRTSIANGDYLGAGANAKDQIGSAAMGLGGSLMSAGGMVATSGIGTIPGAVIAGIGALTMGVGGILKLIAGDEQADNAEARAYESSLPYLHAFNKRYSDGGDIKQHMQQADALREKAVELSKGTGLSTYDFLDTALRQTTYGISQEEALNRTKIAALWANSTGADLATIQDVLGISSRMGRETDTDYLARARNASGLSKAQTQEFLQGLQSVVENGIANGYSKSTEDAAKNFAMFSSLSNHNPLWEGKYAAQKINSISNTIAGATNMDSVDQVLTIDAARKVAETMRNKDFRKLTGFDKTGTYLDAMLIAQNGLTPKLFTEIGKSITALEGDNLVARVEHWKNTSGLNYKGAIELDSMYRNGNMDDTEIEAKIQSMKADKEYQSEETKKMEAINSIDRYVQKIGQSEFWDNYKKLLKIEREQQEKSERIMNPPLHYGSTVTVVKGNEAAAIDQALNDKDLKRLVQKGDLRPGQGGTTYENLINKQGVRFDGRKTIKIGGNDERDTLLKKRFVNWAVTDDRKIDTHEMMSMLRAHDTPEMQKVYNSGNIDEYTAALEKMFKNLLANATFYIRED